MTEVPEYLLQRSKSRRRALGLPVDDDGADAGDAAAPAAAGAGTGGGGGASGPAPTQLAPIEAKETAPPAPEPAYVRAARTRRKPPVWAAAAFAMLPVYLFVYVALLGEDTADAETALGLGQELYGAQCASCHLASGGGQDEGGVGRPLYQGEVELTFPDPVDQFDYIRHGSFAQGTPYGNPDRPGGQHIAATGMPNFPDLTDYELWAIVRYEREVLSGEELDEEQLAEREERFLEFEESGTVTQELQEGGAGGGGEAGSDGAVGGAAGAEDGDPGEGDAPGGGGEPAGDMGEGGGGEGGGGEGGGDTSDDSGDGLAGSGADGAEGGDSDMGG